MRFFTVSDAREARKSVFYATGFMGYFYILTFIIGFGAIMLVGANPAYKDAAGALIGGNNMAAVHPANAVGGNLFLGFISAVAFATILAVVAGLTLAGASAVSHDLYANVFRKGATEREELKVSKITVLVLGVIAILLGVLFENQNIAFMVGLAFAIAASCNFPIILLSMYWSRLTTRGAMLGGWLGLLTAVVLMILGPTIWVQILGHEKAIFPYEYPALFSISIAFLGIWFFSATDNSEEGNREREQFRAQFIRSPDRVRRRTRSRALTSPLLRLSGRRITSFLRTSASRPAAPPAPSPRRKASSPGWQLRPPADQAHKSAPCLRRAMRRQILRLSPFLHEWKGVKQHIADRHAEYAGHHHEQGHRVRLPAQWLCRCQRKWRGDGTNRQTALDLIRQHKQARQPHGTGDGHQRCRYHARRQRHPVTLNHRKVVIHRNGKGDGRRS